MPVTLKVLIEGYLAAKDRPSDVPGRLVFWLDALGDLPITEITPEAVDSAIVRLAERGRLQPRRHSEHAPTGKPLAGATLTRYVSQLAGIFKYARKQRLVPRTWTPPTRGMDLPEPAPIKTSYFTSSDIDRLVKVARMLDTKWRRMADIQRAAADRAELDASELMREIKRVALSDIGGIMHEDGRVKLPHELDPATRAAVASFKIDEYGRIEYKFWDKNAALEKAAKVLGLYKQDNKQRSDSVADFLASLSGNVLGPAQGLPALDDDELDRDSGVFGVART